MRLFEIVLCSLLVCRYMFSHGLDNSSRNYDIQLSMVSSANPVLVNSLRKAMDQIFWALNIDCGWKSLVVLANDSHSALAEEVLKFIGSRSLPFFWVHGVDALNQAKIEEYVEQFYIQQGQVNFMVLSSKPEDIIRNNELIFVKMSRTWLAMMSHRTKWIAIGWDSPGCPGWERKPAHFDNVAYICLRKDHDYSSAPVVASTFMWRENRRRESQTVNLFNRKDVSDCFCDLFPNALRRMNMRPLTILAKEDWGSFVYLVNNSSYEGFTVDVVKILAYEMNFTFELVPHPNTSFSWEDLEDNVNKGKSDFTLNLYLVSDKIFQDFGITYPVKFDSVTLIYKSSSPSTVRSALILLFPLDSIIYFYIIGSIFLVALWTTGLHLASNKIRSRSDSKQETQLSKIVTDQNSFLSKYSPYENPKAVTPAPVPKKRGPEGPNGLVASFVYYIWVYGIFLLNQGYFQNHRSMSVCLITGAWSLYAIVLYATHTSSITAKMVVVEKYLPFTNYQQFADNTEYGLVTLNASEILDALDSSIGSIPGLAEKKEILPYNDWDLTTDRLEHKFAILYLEDLFKAHFKYREYSIHNIVFMEKKLFTANRGFLLPNNSELTGHISYFLKRMHDMAIIEFLYYQQIPNAQPTPKPQKRTVMLDDLIYPFCVVLIILFVGFVVLCLELGVTFLRKKRDLVEEPKLDRHDLKQIPNAKRHLLLFPFRLLMKEKWC